MAMKPHFDTRDMTDAQIAKKMKEDFDARHATMSTRDMGFGPCPVVKVRSNERGHPEGFTEINLSDFDPRKHKLWDESDAPQTIKDIIADSDIMLIGANNLPATVDVGGDGEIQLGDVVRAAQAKSGLTVKDWNAQSGAAINDACVAMVFEMTQTNRKAKAEAAKKRKPGTKPVTHSGFQ